jgi:hypothetical protein
MKLDKNYYIELGVLDWLYDENINQKIRLERSGCYKYKLNNQLHRLDGAAIEYFSGVGNQYYINGNKITWEEFINNKREIILNEIDSEK